MFAAHRFTPLLSLAIAALAAPAAAQTSEVPGNTHIFSEDFEGPGPIEWGLDSCYVAGAGECGNPSRAIVINDGPGTCTFGSFLPGNAGAQAINGVGFHPTVEMEVHFDYRFLLPSGYLALSLSGAYYDGYINLKYLPLSLGDDTWQHESFVYHHVGWEPDNPAGSGGFPWLQYFDNSSPPTSVPGGVHLDNLLIRPEGAGTAFCDGVACPCGNDDTTPIARGCKNSTGRGAWLHAYGETSVTSDELRVVTYDLPLHRTLVLFGGTAQVNGGAGQPFGDGLRCVGGALTRIALQTSGGLGEFTWAGLAQDQGWAGGQTVRLQVYYRDTTGPCGTGFNTTNGYSFVVTP